eukprot:4137600-Amphidinium_carterae.2
MLRPRLVDYVYGHARSAELAKAQDCATALLDLSALLSSAGSMAALGVAHLLPSVLHKIAATSSRVAIPGSG